ncbi:MAG: hypothetical protein HQL52_05085 [Magnetococcales bacterium]|nr:hypothetical protein [Magnetococcales bacterium]
MTQSIRQMQIAYAPDEDRLLLKVNTSDQSEFRFWLTRRFLRGLWPGLQQALIAEEAIRSHNDPEAKRAILDFLHRGAIDKGDFQTPYKEEALQTPLGEKPILVTRTRISEGKDGTRVVAFLPKSGPGIDIGMGRELLHSFYNLLIKVLPKTGWDLKLSPPRELLEERPAKSERRLH